MSMKLEDLKAGMRIKATAGDGFGAHSCFEVGDEFDVFTARGGELAIRCRQTDSGDIPHRFWDDRGLVNFDPLPSPLIAIQAETKL